MTTESSGQAKKKMPWTESVPLLIGLAVVAAVVLFLVGGVVFADSDEMLRRKVLGTWRICFEDRGCIENTFSANGELAMTDGATSLRGTWSIENGGITVHFKGGGDWLSSTIVGLTRLFGTRADDVIHRSISFDGDSVMYLGSEKFVRLGHGND
jgi:hypothetical protein